jgi:hypothetical protein
MDGPKIMTASRGGEHVSFLGCKAGSGVKRRTHFRLVKISRKSGDVGYLHYDVRLHSLAVNKHQGQFCLYSHAYQILHLRQLMNLLTSQEI